MKLLWIAALAAAIAHGQDPAPAAADLGAFALPDESGTRLIAIGGLPKAEVVHRAVCSDGSEVRVRFGFRQAERGDATRQVPAAFARLGGDVFRVVRGQVDATANCFLIGGGWIAGAAVVPVKAGKGGDCGVAEVRQIEAARERAVARCSLVARLAGNGRVLLAEFAKAGDDALASVVLMGGQRVLFGDYPAKFRGEGADLWRVDDGGVLSAEDFRVVFVARRAGRYALGISWAGTEGRSLVVFDSGRGEGFHRVIDAYWYQAPR